MHPVAQRFCRYAGIHTESDSKSNWCPSTKGQLNLGKLLYDELTKIGLSDVNFDTNGYVWASLNSNTDKTIPKIGFIAHMDTSPDFTGKNVKPKITEHYSGQPIILDEKEGIILSPDDFPDLLNYIGQELITTDGNTLLGADDKAGIAEIMEAVQYLVEHPNLKHGEIKVGFTVDEEIGRGADRFPIKKFGADFAYTLDGGPIGELEYENFNAAIMKVRVKGRNVHPGTAKGKMINALQACIDFHNRLPSGERPEKTQDYEGFFHLLDLSGGVEEASMEYIIRDHDKQKFESKKDLAHQVAKDINLESRTAIIELEIRDQYFNMKEKIEPVMHIVDLASTAMKAEGIKPLIKPIRGGTDGSKLSFMGLPTPNLFNGGHNFHGRFEFIPVQSMIAATKLIVRIATDIVDLADQTELK